MAGNGNDWNSFMQQKSVQMLMYGICVLFCLYYAVDGIMEMMSPERSALMMQSLGATGYYALTIVRTIVLVCTAGAFARMVLRMRSEDEG